MLLIKTWRPVIFIALLLAFGGVNDYEVQAQVLSGSRTEQRVLRKTEQLLRQARRHFEGNRVQQALDIYWQILEINPDATYAYLELGDLYYHLRIFNRTIELLEPGLKFGARADLDPDLLCHYYCVLTQAYLATDQMGLASRALIKAAEIAPRNPLPRKILGDIYLENNRLNDAIKAYKKAVELDPEYGPALQKLGQIALEHNLGQEAQLVLQTLSAQDPDRAEDYRAQMQEAKITPSSRPARPIATPEPLPEQPSRPQKQTTRPTPAPVAKKIEPINGVPLALPQTKAPAPRPVPMPPQEPKPELTPVRPPAQPQAAQPVSAETEEEEFTATEEEIEQTIDKLLAGNQAEKDEASAFFAKLGNKGLIEVEELIYDPDPDVRIIAIRTLPGFKKHASRAREILNDAMTDPDPGVRDEIGKALKRLE